VLKWYNAIEYFSLEKYIVEAYNIHPNGTTDNINKNTAVFLKILAFSLDTPDLILDKVKYN